MLRRLGAVVLGAGLLAFSGAGVAVAGTITPTEGVQFSGQVATYTAGAATCQPTNPTATINWNDGSPASPGGATASGYTITITGTHTYGEEGTYAYGTVSGTYQCPGTVVQYRTTFSATAFDAALHAGGTSATTTAGQSLTTTVATFTDADAYGTASDYTATVDWGDGSSTTSGAVSAQPSGFAVTATHSYSTAGDYTATVTIKDAGGSQATAQTAVTVAAAGGQNISVAPGTQFNGPVATFTPNCLLSLLATGAHATIGWGDGQTSAADVLSTNGGAELVFDGSHTYTNPGNYTGIVTGTYNCGNQTLNLPPLHFGGVINLTTSVELRSQGMDVTQGITDDNYLLVPSGGGSGLSYRGFGFSPPDFSNDALPGDSPLVQGNTTVVRVYADAHGAGGSGISGVGVALYGTANGAPLPGSPLMADYGPSSLPDTGMSDPGPVFLPERTSDKNAYTFTLPYSWTTAGPINLTAQVIPPSSVPFPYSVCNTSACQAARSFTMSDVSFVRLPYMVVAPLAMLRPGQSALPDPYDLYSRALQTEPDAQNYIIRPYVATVDPTQVINDPTAFDPGGDLNNGYLQLVWDFSFFYYFGAPRNAIPDLTSGINWDQRGVTPGGHSTYDYPAIGYDLTNATRPITSIAHELGHYLGRNHADEPKVGCGGSGGPWPPDHLGYMQGIGLDMSTHPYTILYPGLSGGPSQWYDKMSYCANTNESTSGGNLPDAWTSPYGWLHSISALWLYGQKVGRASDVAAAADPAPGATIASATQLVVSAVIRDGKAQIVSVLPSSIPSPASGSSTVQLVSLDKAGHVLSSTNLDVLLTHDDPGPSYMDLVGTVPAAGVSTLELVHDGTVIATRARPAHHAILHILAPSAGARVGRQHGVTLRWRASEAGNPLLTIFVQYSSDGGRHWRTVYVGPNRGRTTLPSWYFAASRNARVRVTAGDGFNLSSALSPRFTALGSPPQVRIISPRRDSAIAGDAHLQLAGQAFDQSLAMLRGRHLQWFDGPFKLGSGANLSAPALPPGRNVIRLLASAGGQTAATSVTVTVTPVSLPFLHLHIPVRISRHARSLAITASSSLATTLTINGHRFNLTSKRKRLVLRIRPGSPPLLLELTVLDDGVRVPFAAVVYRSR